MAQSNTSSPFTQIFGKRPETAESSTPKASKGDTAEQDRKIAATEPTPKTIKAADLVSGNTTAAAAASTSAAATPPSGERIDAVRDLLFGDQMGEIKDSMRAVETLLLDRLAAFEKEIRAEAESAKRSTREEFENMGALLRKESTAREAFSTEVGNRLDLASRDLGDKITKLREETEQTSKETRNQSEERESKLSRDLRELIATLQSTTEKEIVVLREASADREDLGSMFAELGRRLKAPPAAGRD